MPITKHGSGDGRILKDKTAAKPEWTDEDAQQLVEEQADVLEDQDEG